MASLPIATIPLKLRSGGYFGHHGRFSDILYHVILQFMLHEGSRGSNEIHYKMVVSHFVWVCYNILLSLVS